MNKQLLVNLVIVCLAGIAGSLLSQKIFGVNGVNTALQIKQEEVKLKDYQNTDYEENNKGQHNYFYDSYNKERLDLGMYNGQPGQNFFGEDLGRPLRLQFGTYTNDFRSNEEGLPSLTLYNRKGLLNELFRLDGPNQSSLLILKDSAGTNRLLVGVGLSSADEEPFLIYFDKAGNKHSLFGDIDWHP